MNGLAARLAACLLAIACLGPHSQAFAQRQLPDREFQAVNDNPAYGQGQGPQILISTTNNSYVERGSLDPFAKLAESDGFAPRRQAGPLTDELAGFEGILVIANPFLENYREFPAIEPPSAFSDAEIVAVRKWVEAGGSLLLLADHAPFGGGSSALASAFGFTFLNGHAVNTTMANAGIVHARIEFKRGEGLNGDHPITNGATGIKPVERYYCFGGQAIIPPDGAVNLLTIPQNWSAVFTYRINSELDSAMRIDASGLSQGAAMEYGEGLLAVFGEAGGFTAQIIDGERKFGFNTEDGSDNPEFILATLRWLARHEPEGR